MNWERNWVAFITILNKEVTRFMRIWQQTVFPPVITTALYFVIFGNLIGPRIGEMAGHTYMEFIVPGLILMAVINNSYANVSSSFFGAKFQRSIEELQVAPVPNSVVLLGFVCGGILRGLLVGIVVTLVSLFFSDLSIHNFLVSGGIILLTALLFSLAGFLNGMCAKKFDDVTIIPNFILTPLTFLGGVFYSIKLLPEFWQVVSHANPILYMISGFRFGFLGTADIDLTTSFLLIFVFCVVLFMINLRLLDKGFNLRQ